MSSSFLTKLLRFPPRYVFAALCTLYLFTLGLWRQRLLIYKICEHFGWPQPDWLNRPPMQVPEVCIAQLVSRDVQITVSEDRTDGNTSLLEEIVINKLVKQHRPERVFEIGTFDGRTTWQIAANTPESTRILTLDLPRDERARFVVCENDKKFIDKPESGARFKGTEQAKKITQLYGDSATFDFTPYYRAIDFVFIDGSHAYDYVLSDSQVALQLVKGRNAIILWHDYGEWDGVTNALNELHANDQRFRELRWIKGTTLVYLKTGPGTATGN
jgi:predicted O-methyltransferase YrrM